MDNLLPLILQLVGGAAGGNLIAKLLKKLDLGPIDHFEFFDQFLEHCSLCCKYCTTTGLFRNWSFGEMKDLR